MNIIDLPNELLYDIIKLLPNNDYYNLVQSNSEFNVLSDSEINYRKYNGKTLNDVCKKGDINGVKYLVSIGRDIRKYNDVALRYAISNGHIEIVKYLVSVGANINALKDEELEWYRLNI